MYMYFVESRDDAISCCEETKTALNSDWVSVRPGSVLQMFQDKW